MLIGIDFGTTSSCVAVLEDGEPTVIENAEGERTMRSVVRFTADGWFGVGAEALETGEPLTAVTSIKRLLGRMEAEVPEAGPAVPYALVAGANGEARIALDAGDYGAVEVTAMILAKLKADAEAYLGQPVDGAVVAVPAYFDDDQRQATLDAGAVAGLDVRRIVNEPTAASLAYGLDQVADETILVVDLGGGGFSACVVEFGDGIFEVRSAAGDCGCGGDGWDAAIVAWLFEEIADRCGGDVGQDAMAPARSAALTALAERAKIELSTATETRIAMPRDGADNPALDVVLTREHLAALAAPLLDRLDAPVRQVIDDAKFKGTKTVDSLVVVGGMGAVPAIRRRLFELTGLAPVAAMAGTETVALGAAIQAGVMEGDVRDVLLLDVTPHTIGIETDGLVDKLIERNTTIPNRKSDMVTTIEDDQLASELHLVQGERAVAAENKSLGLFHVSGFPPAARGVAQIEVIYDLDFNGMLAVSAKDAETGGQLEVWDPRHVAMDADEIAGMAAAVAERHLSPIGPEPAAAEHVGASRPPRGGGPESLPRRPQGRDHPMRPIRVFVSYSHKDKAFLASLEETLAILRSQGLLDAWHDGLIEPGTDWRSAIEQELEHADLILLLVSRPFLASPFCREEEMRVALERHAAGEARVIPLLIRPSDWQNTDLKDLQALPSEGLPVSKWADQDDAWQDVTDALRQVLKDLQA